MVALEHCGGHLSGGARALRTQIRTHIRSNGGKIKGLNCRQDQRTQVLDPGANPGGLTGAKFSHGT